MFLSIFIPLFVCFCPLILCIILFSTVCKQKFLHLLIASLLGLAAVLPISFIQFLLPGFNLFTNSPILNTICQSLIIYSLTEEVFKTILILPIPKKQKTLFDFLLLSFTFGIALGCFESVVYFLDHLQIANQRGAKILYGSIFARIFSSDIIHLTCSGLCGLFIFSVRNKNTKISCLITAILIHGFYDFFAGLKNNIRYFAIFAILLAIIECRIKYKALTNISQTSETSA